MGVGERMARPLVAGMKDVAWRRFLLAAAIVMLMGGAAWWLRPYALAAYHVEAGGRALDEALEPVFSDRLAPEQVTDADQLGRAEAHLQTALRWQRESVQARRLLARVYLSTGRLEAALKVLGEAVELRPENPIFHLELGDAYDALGNTEAAVEAYEEGRIGSRGVPLAANLLKLAGEKAQQGSGDVAIELWQKTLEGDPGNLYTLYRLEGAHRELGDEKQAKRYEERLRYFELESVEVPIDFRLAAFQGRAMAGLVGEGIWEREKLLNVVSYQVWQFAEGVRGLMTERLLETVLEQRPEDADVLFYKGELYQRRGELDKAEEAYEQVLAVDAEYAQAYLRLGSLAEERGREVETETGRGGEGETGGGNLSEAAAWYNRYHETAPDDLLVLKRLLQVCGVLEEADVEDENCRAVAGLMRTADEETRGQEEGGGPPAVLGMNSGEENGAAAVLEAALAERRDDRRIVAELLDVPVEDVELGPNLVENGGFEAWSGGGPEGWTWSDMFSREPFNRATFVGGADSLLPFEEEQSARVDGLWVEELEGNSAARAGFWHSREVSVATSTPYVVSLCYTTDGTARDQGAAIWLSDDHDVFWRSNLWLNNTDGRWFRFVAVTWNHSAGEGAVRPLIRSFAAGSLRIDDLQVRSIEFSEETRIIREDTRVWEG